LIFFDFLIKHELFQFLKKSGWTPSVDNFQKFTENGFTENGFTGIRSLRSLPGREGGER
jgi:hypothetical protein